MANIEPAFLSDTSTKEVEKILGKKLNILFAIDIKGNIRRLYPNHFDKNKLSSLEDKEFTTSLIIETRIPKCEIKEVEESIMAKLFGHHCPCGVVGGKCRTCD